MVGTLIGAALVAVLAVAVAYRAMTGFERLETHLARRDPLRRRRRGRPAAALRR